MTERARVSRKPRGKRVHPDTVRLAALRALTGVVAQSAGPIDIQGPKQAQLTALLAAGKDAEDISIELSLPIDAVIPLLWRIAQAAA